VRLARNVDVLMPTMHLDRLPEGVVAEPFGEVELRGFPGSIDVVRLTGAPHAGDRQDTADLWSRDPFV
jgi:adenylate cyclase